MIYLLSYCLRLNGKNTIRAKEKQTHSQNTNRNRHFKQKTVKNAGTHRIDKIKSNKTNEIKRQTANTINKMN